MPLFTLNFSLKRHSKVNIYLDGKYISMAKTNDSVKLTVDSGRHSLRLVQYRGKNERSAAAVGAIPYFSGGSSLNGDGTKSQHLLPWRATVHYCECEFDADITGDASVSILSSVEKRRGFIGIDNHFISLKVGTSSGAEIGNVTVKSLDGKQQRRFNMWQRIILLLTYLPIFVLVVWQTEVAVTNWSAPATFGIMGKYYILLPVLLALLVLIRIIFFLRKMHD